jgi:MSHA biogenesis protein MshN
MSAETSTGMLAPVEPNANTAAVQIVSSLSKQPSRDPAALADAAYQNALAQWTRGEQKNAEIELYNVLSLQADHIAATTLLASLYLEQNRASEAEALLSTALKRNADNIDIRLLLARARLGAHKPGEALALLREREPSLQKYSDYYAVMAALEQQLNRYAEAATHYAALVEFDATQSTWWLGLAIALENQHSADAKPAYRRALALGTLPPAARDYAAARAALVGEH